MPVQRPLIPLRTVTAAEGEHCTAVSLELLMRD